MNQQLWKLIHSVQKIPKTILLIFQLPTIKVSFYNKFDKENLIFEMTNQLQTCTGTNIEMCELFFPSDIQYY